ncbi:MAG: hypothetical protein HFI19_03960 [Lachnospiraceae bacterium]|uniref:hypothetical protein n=1 Tax=Candidatus Merdisoma sp. JLR.KK006 TaxID=3112626 RepID=UPI002FF0B1D5|nr:hypothetical protein [Lachnospiraceae bacterium]
MHTKAIEGLVGASMNAKLMNTPLQVYNEASRRGDTAAMGRAMEYAGECTDKAGECMKKVEKGMEEDAKEAKEKAKLERENAIRKRKEERGELEKRIAESKNRKMDTVEISGSEKATGTGDAGQNQPGQGGEPVKIVTDAVKAEPTIYTRAGEVSQEQPEAGESISVSV